MAAAVIALAGLVAIAVTAMGSDDGDDGEDPRTVQPGAPGEESRELDEDAADVAPPEHTEVDVEFAQRMIVHHQQALDMAALVAARTQRDDLPQLAERVTVAQEAEIELIGEWLTERDADVPDESNHLQHEGMPGMATEAQLAELEAARGPAFDRLFLELMITHHQGALQMVQDLYNGGGGLEPAIDGIARGVDADQSIEIRRMQELLDSLP